MIRQSVYDVDALDRSLEHLNARCTLLEPAPHGPWELRRLPFRNATVQSVAASCSYVCEGRTSADAVTFVLPLRGVNRVRADGLRMDAQSLVTLAPGAEFCLAFEGACQWAAFTTSDPHLAITAATVASATPSQSPVRQMTAGTAAHLRATLDAVFAAPDARPAPATIRDLTDIATAVLSTTALAQGSHRAIPRARIVREAVTRSQHREFNVAQVSVNDLAGAAGVSERTLRTAFCECYRTGPRHFLKLRQLHDARRTLRQASPNSTTVTEVATGLGLCELGKFARDYRRLFGESPSVTLRDRTPSSTDDQTPAVAAPLAV